MSATIGTPPPTSALNLNNGVRTASAPVLQTGQTWNNSGVSFVAESTNVTDTASGSGSLLRDWKVNGVSKFSVSKLGNTVANSINCAAWAAGEYLWSKGNTEGVYFGINQDTSLRRVSAGLLKVHNGALQTKLRLETAAAPASAADTGSPGELRWDADYLYVCTAADTWVRTALSTW